MKLIDLLENNKYITQSFELIKRSNTNFVLKYQSGLGNIKKERYFEIKQSILDENKLIAYEIDKNKFNLLNSNLHGKIEIKENKLPITLNNIDIIN